jgi:hypothetical protein
MLYNLYISLPRLDLPDLFGARQGTLIFAQWQLRCIIIIIIIIIIARIFPPCCSAMIIKKKVPSGF